MDIKAKLSTLIAVDGMSSEEVAKLFLPSANNMGDYSLPCFRFAKAMKMSPQDIATKLKEQMEQSDLVAKVEAVNGYLNIFLSGSVFAREVLAEALQEGYGSSDIGTGKTICIDYSSINIAKPFHIGHLGTTAIGSSLYKIHQKLGYKVVGINHLGDWGTQFGKLIVAYEKWGDKETIQKGGVKALQEIYVKFHIEEEKDPTLTQQAREWFLKIEQGDKKATELFLWFKEITLTEVGKIYKTLNVHFDSFDGESFFNDKMQDVIDELKAKNIAETSQGALVVNLDDQNMPPCLLVKADGATLYATRDLAAAVYRKKTYDFYKSLYVVAYQQDLHFKQLFAVLEKMDKSWAKDCVHVSYGMVSLEEGSMSTRKGNVVWLESVLDKAVEKAFSIINQKSPDLVGKEQVAKQIGVGAVVFSAVQNARIKDITFSFDNVLNFEGETSPYLQYTYARVQSLMDKAGNCLLLRIAPNYNVLDNTVSKEVVKLVNNYSNVLLDAAEKYEPSILAKYLIDLAQAFNKFYFEQRIIGEDMTEQVPKMQLSVAVGKVLKEGLSLLGIQAPNKM